MKTVKFVLIAVLCVVVVIIIWRIGFYKPPASIGAIPPAAQTASDSTTVGDANSAAEDFSAEQDIRADIGQEQTGKPGEEEFERPAQEQAAEGPEQWRRDRGGFRSDRRWPGEWGERPGRPGKEPESEPPSDPNSPVAVNLNNVEMKDIIETLAEWTGAKAVIPTSDEVMQKRVTIYATRRLPRTEALAMLYAALQTRGVAVVHTDDVIYLKPVKDVRVGRVPTVSADEPLAAIENKNQVVEKFFKLKNSTAARLQEIVLPLVGEHGYISADEGTRTLMVIDTVENLMRIEKVIGQFDVPEAEQTVTKIFEVQYGDPRELVQVLNLLVGQDPQSRRANRRQEQSQPRPSGGNEPPRSGETEQVATSVLIQADEGPVVLIPEPRRKWIIARASAELINRIGDWIEKLDRIEEVESESETIPVTYADVDEVADQLNEALEEMPGSGLRPSVLIRPLEQSRQIIVFGRPEMRQMVKNLIAEIDVPTGEFVTKVFELEHADPEQVKENLDELYSDMDSGSQMDFWRRGRRGRTTTTNDMVRTIAFPAMHQITVVASPENMARITEQLEQWDTPLDVNKVKPLIINLHNSDPVQMAELLGTLFSSQAEQQNRWPFSIFARSSSESQQKIVGPLYGQLTFKAVPGSKKIVVISKIPEAYRVIEEFVRELDEQEMAEVPKVITLKYADPEQLCERLNAIFNEPGTSVSIRFSERGLSEYSMDQTESNQQTQTQQQSSSTQYQPWWGSGYRAQQDEMPISNVIGRIRFIPDRRSKSLLVLSPPEFLPNVEAMVHELDVPGKQVMIKAVIVEVDHRDLTSLGLQLARREESFGTLDENAAVALTELSLLEERGSFTLRATMDVSTLIDFLVKKVDAKILNQQTLWTKDNEEAQFFKGQTVAFNTDVSVSETGGRVTSGIEFQKVGMTLRARPSITPEKNVDMTVNVTISQLTPDEINAQPVRDEMETTTNMIVQDGQTLLLGGILFQQDSRIERKLPLLGDVPLVGGLFRHNEVSLANNEMLVFITPYVIDEPGVMQPDAEAQLRRSLEKLDDIKKYLDKWLEQGNLQDALPDKPEKPQLPAPSEQEAIQAGHSNLEKPDGA